LNCPKFSLCTIYIYICLPPPIATPISYSISCDLAGTLTVEEVYKDRDQFAALVREVAAPDVGRMGIEILSFTIKDVYDDVQYLASLGKAQTAVVKRDADAGVAEANRDAGIREAECEKSAMDVKYSTDTKIEDNTRMYKLQKANFDQEINTAKAESQLAYELQAAKIRQRIRNEEIQIEVVERRKQIEIETQEVHRKDRELYYTIILISLFNIDQFNLTKMDFPLRPQKY